MDETCKKSLISPAPRKNAVKIQTPNTKEYFVNLRTKSFIEVSPCAPKYFDENLVVIKEIADMGIPTKANKAIKLSNSAKTLILIKRATAR